MAVGSQRVQVETAELMSEPLNHDCTHKAARQILKLGCYESVAITEAIYPKGRVIEKHSHSLPNLGLVIRGCCSHKVGTAREESCVPGELHYLPTGEKHSFKFGSDAHCLLLRINAPTLERLMDLGNLTYQPGKQPGEALRSLSRRLIWEFQLNDEATPLALEGLVLEILAQMSRSRRLPPCAPCPAILRARDLLHDLMGTPLKLNQIAREVEMHPAHLARQFRKTFHRTMSEYLREIRVQRALEVLQESDTSLSEISQLCGFCDQSHFSRAFKQITGVSPSAYRQQASLVDTVPQLVA